MKNILICWDEFVELIQNQQPILFLDYDGTLTPIVDDPDKAVLSPEVKTCIQNLSAAKGMKVVVISGRSLEDLKKRIQIKEVIYVGNHGFELEGPKIHHIHPDAERFVPLLKKIEEELRQGLESIPGVSIENKIYTLSVHYRRAAEADIPRANGLFLKTIDPFLKNSQVIVCEGKKVWEVRPSIPWDKGKMVLWLFGRMIFQSSGGRVEPVYIGDDETDEHALEVIRGRGIGIKVTEAANQNSFASWYLKNPAEVLSFLKKLEILESKSLSKSESGI